MDKVETNENKSKTEDRLLGSFFYKLNFSFIEQDLAKMPNPDMLFLEGDELNTKLTIN